MNRLSPVPRAHLRGRFFSGPRGLLLAGLLACAGCAVEDPVAYILDPDSGTGPLSTDGGPGEQWAPPEEGLAPDCGQDVPDAGVACADAGER
jgi:hypothetical protein